jgi:hypothetical protein
MAVARMRWAIATVTAVYRRRRPRSLRSLTTCIS